jgi:hypothetical protein
MGLAYELTDDELRTLIEGRCAFCGILPYRKTKGKSKGSIFHNGIDRWWNDQGYLLQNVVTCCTPCNLMKADMDGETFLKMVHLIASNHRLLYSAPHAELEYYRHGQENVTQSRRLPPSEPGWLSKLRHSHVGRVAN